MSKRASRAPVLHTPVDAVTGLPYAILPYDTESGLENGHHHQFPSTHLMSPTTRDMLYDFILEPEDLNLQELGNLVVRMSRVQVLPLEVHVVAHQKLLGPQLPETLDEKFQAFVRAYLGLVSRWAIDVRKSSSDVKNMLVYMDDDMFAKVANRRRLSTEHAGVDHLANYRRRFFGSFLLRYAMEQEATGYISPSVIDEFLDTKDDQRRKELGNFILTAAVETKIAPLVPLHQKLQRQGLAQPGRADARVMLRNLIDKNRLPALFPALTDRLLAAA